MFWTKNTSLACWLQAMLITLLGCAIVFSQETASLEARRAEAKKAYTAGQYKQAFELYKEIALSDNNTGEYAALDFGMACDSLCKLKNGDGHDRSESIKILNTIYPALGRKYEKDWKFLTNLIHSLKNSANNSFELFFFLDDSNHLVEKLENLLPTLPETGENHLRVRCYSFLASYDDPQDIHYGREFFFCEIKDNAQTTDLDDETSEETLQGEDAWQRSAYCNKCLTHDGQLKPVTMPEAYKQSRLRGEKWLWCRARMLECVHEEEKADILLSTADTLYRLFGEWSAIRSHFFFPLDGKPIPETYLNQLRSLKENETLLRFDRTTFLIRPLPEAVDFYRIYKSLAEKGNAKAMLRLGQIHENRRQLDTALEWYQKALTLLPDKPLRKKLQNEVIPRLSGPSLSFSPFTMIPPNTPSSQAFIGRNLKTVQFKLQRIDNDKLLAHFLKLGSDASTSKGFIDDYSPVSNIGSYGFSAFWMEMPVHNLPDDCLVPNPRIWKCDYPLPDDHADIASAVELPPLEPGFYRLTATLENGVTTIKDLLCNDTHIIQTDNHKNEWGHYLVLDAVTGTPLEGVTATFFYQVSKSSPIRSIDVSSDKHGRITLTRQMLDYSDTPSSQKKADNEDTTPFVKWYLLHIHGQNRFTFTPPTPFWPKDDTHRKYPSARQVTVYAVTDRYLYHPGETVHFNIWLADRIQGLPLANRSVTAIVHRNGNDEKDKSNILLPLTTDNYGSANGSFTLPENARLGYYAISLTMDDYQTAVRHPKWDYAIRHNFDTVFTVSNYVKPETSLEIQLPETTPKPGDEFDIHFQADYLFGKAVTNATLDCTVLIGELAGEKPQFPFKNNWFCKEFHDFYDALGKIDSDNEDEKIRYLNPDVDKNRMNDID
ncbi:MAG: hypothetical protein IJT83_02755, partial [Victivallales bacterium]|nr:hypothetical protein [Victivallales bacterium]